MRQYIRHPVDVPIEIRTSRQAAPSAVPTTDIGVGGLAVRSETPVPPGALIEVRIPYVQPPFEARARVAWCRAGRRGGHELGVAFLDAEDAFLARMVEQVCHIQDYQAHVARAEGRVLSADEAATEWIDKFAARFPGAGGTGGTGGAGGAGGLQ